MTPHPLRFQRKRTKGYRMPEGGVSCARPGKFGNPFTIEGCREAGYTGTDDEIRKRCVDAFRVWLGPYWRENWDGEESQRRRRIIIDAINSGELRGKPLGCFCRLDQDCHVDVLLDIINKKASE